MDGVQTAACVPHAAQLSHLNSQLKVPALPRVLSMKWLDRKLSYNLSTDLVPKAHSTLCTEKTHTCTNAYGLIHNYKYTSRSFFSALVVCTLRYWHTIEPCSLLIGAQCLRWGEQPIVMCCASVKRHRFNYYPPYYQGLRGPSQPWLYGNGPLSNIIKRDQFSTMDFCQGTRVGIIFKITLYIEVSECSSTLKKNNPHTAWAYFHIDKNTH